MLEILANTGGQLSAIWAMFYSNDALAGQVLQIIIIDILLAGDNAVVIALACRSLPPKQRTIGIVLGALVAIVLRIIFAAGITVLMTMPYLKLVGGLLLFWIAIKLLLPEDAHETNVSSSSNLWGAVRTVAIADLVMSLDNVVAIAAAAKGNVPLIAFGLVVSIPLIIGGATLILNLLTRYPILIWAGAALLGWIAGELIYKEAFLTPYFDQFGAMFGIGHAVMHYVMAAIGAILVVVLSWLLLKWRRAGPASAT